MIADCKKKYRWEFNCHNKNIYTAKRTLETTVTPSTSDYGIDDDDFRKIMEILQNGKFK